MKNEWRMRAAVRSNPLQEHQNLKNDASRNGTSEKRFQMRAAVRSNSLARASILWGWCAGRMKGKVGGVLKELVRKQVTFYWPSENETCSRWGSETSVPRFVEPKQLEQTQVLVKNADSDHNYAKRSPMWNEPRGYTSTCVTALVAKCGHIPVSPNH